MKETLEEDKKMNRTELREAIVSVCLDWASLEDIATERNADQKITKTPSKIGFCKNSEN